MADEFAEVEDPSMKGVEKLGFKGKNSSTAETTREKQRWERLSQRNVGAGVGRGGRKQSWQYQCNYCDLGDGGLWQSWATGGGNGKGCANQKGYRPTTWSQQGSPCAYITNTFTNKVHITCGSLNCGRSHILERKGWT